MIITLLGVSKLQASENLCHLVFRSLQCMITTRLDVSKLQASENSCPLAFPVTAMIITSLGVSKLTASDNSCHLVFPVTAMIVTHLVVHISKFTASESRVIWFFRSLQRITCPSIYTEWSYKNYS